MASATKSSHSPLRLPPVAVACIISNNPPISAGNRKININCAGNDFERRLRHRSKATISDKAKYIAICVHLSIRVKPDSGVLGICIRQTTHITRIINVVIGNSLTIFKGNCMIVFKFVAKVRIFVYFCTKIA